MDVVRHIYTQPGPQKAVPVGVGRGCFVLTLQPGDEGFIETTCDPLRLASHQMRWERYEGGLAGAVAEITALRVVLGPLIGWAELVVESAPQTQR